MNRHETLVVAAYCKEVYPFLTDGQMAAIAENVKFFPDVDYAKEALLDMIRLNSERLNITAFLEKLHSELRRRGEIKAKLEKAHERAVGNESIARFERIKARLAEMSPEVLTERLRQALATLKPEAAEFMAKHDIRKSPFLQSLVFDTDEMVRAFD